MRLWSYQLLKYLPKSQLRAQWRELNSIFVKQNKHILINYVYDYPKNDLYSYSIMVIREIYKKGMKIKNFKNFFDYFGVFKVTTLEYVEKPFKNHHNFDYLEICYYNLKEKYICGQSDFDAETFEELDKIYSEEHTKDILKNCIKVDLKKRRKNEV